jgi:hypothetical protein
MVASVIATASRRLIGICGRREKASSPFLVGAESDVSEPDALIRGQAIAEPSANPTVFPGVGVFALPSPPSGPPTRVS